MVFNSTFNNISVISWWSVLLEEETRVLRVPYMYDVHVYQVSDKQALFDAKK